MRWCFLVQMEDSGRMQARVMQVVDQLQVSMESFSSVKLDGRIFLSFIVETEQKMAERIEALVRKIHGMASVQTMPEATSMQRVIALFRVRCDLSERNELLQFIGALNARTMMIRPSWVSFEVIGSTQEIEGIYQSALSYGIVDCVSPSCVFMASA